MSTCLFIAFGLFLVPGSSEIQSDNEPSKFLLRGGDDYWTDTCKCWSFFILVDVSFNLLFKLSIFQVNPGKYIDEHLFYHYKISLTFIEYLSFRSWYRTIYRINVFLKRDLVKCHFSALSFKTNIWFGYSLHCFEFIQSTLLNRWPTSNWCLFSGNPSWDW